MSFVPEESSSQKGLYFHFYTKRIAKAFGLEEEHLPSLLPSGVEPWKQSADAGPWTSGLAGYFRTVADLDKLRQALDGTKQPQGLPE